MYKDTRPATSNAETASTPELWALTFAKATRMNAWRTFRHTITREWALIRRHIPLGARVLDAGCGFGEWVSFLHTKGYRAEGLDFSKELVTRLTDTYSHLKWTHGDVTRLPYEDESFDALISWGVIEHDETGPARALAEFGRVLKPGGVAIVTVPTDSIVQRRSANYLYHRTAERQVFFQYFMTADDLASHVRGAGLEVVDAGILPNAVLQLVSPLLAARLHGLSFRAANLVASSLFSRLDRYCVMRYSVARKPGAVEQR
jgi:ubiquinone/menaquinone biosynthesis C-methylase UbiE